MESKRKNVYITIFVITTIIASCAAVYFYLKATNNKLVAGNKESEVASQENQTTTNVDVAKEVKEKIVYKNVMPELDPNKCIEGSKDGGTYQLRVADSFSTALSAVLTADKKTIEISINCEEINKLYNFNYSSNNFDMPINIRFEKDVVDLCVSTLGGQSVGYEVLIILLKDGTVEYIPLYNAIKNNNIKSYGKIEGITDIVRIGTVKFNGTEFGGFLAPCAIKSDGSFYDLSERLKKILPSFN